MATSATFTAKAGHSYAFYSIARDLVGNVEAPKTVVEATAQTGLAFMTLTAKGEIETGSHPGTASNRRLVRIELGRASCRRGVTSLTLSVARWVHIPAMTKFPEAPR